MKYGGAVSISTSSQVQEQDSQGPWTLDVAAMRPVEYQVIESEGLFAPDSQLARELTSPNDEPRLVVIDESVADAVLPTLEPLVLTGPNRRVLVLTGGEKKKSAQSAAVVLEAMQSVGVLRRTSPTVVIGGGVVCDVVGYAAAIYRRGVPYVRVPTTLLAQVDVGVAAKVAINHFGFRNRLGAFHPADRTYVDRSFLSTVPRSHIRNGLGEIVKLAIIQNEDLFTTLERDAVQLLDDKFVSAEGGIVTRLALESMAGSLQNNLFEVELRRSVDFGHTFSPVIEMRTGLLHGEAVALDCAFSTHLAWQRGLLSEASADRILSLMKTCELPVKHAAFREPELLQRALADTKIHRDGNQHIPLPTAIGQHTFVEDVSDSEIVRAARMM